MSMKGEKGGAKGDPYGKGGKGDGPYEEIVVEEQPIPYVLPSGAGGKGVGAPPAGDPPPPSATTAKSGMPPAAAAPPVTAEAPKAATGPAQRAGTTAGTHGHPGAKGSLIPPEPLRPPSAKGGKGVKPNPLPMGPPPQMVAPRGSAACAARPKARPPDPLQGRAS